MRIYGLDVKDRIRGENRSTFAHICTRTYMARNCGAHIRYQYANATLAYVKLWVQVKIDLHTLQLRY